jgi:hypothetical protein
LLALCRRGHTLPSPNYGFTAFKIVKMEKLSCNKELK